MSARADGVNATRDRIERAALELFIDQPYEAVTLAAIATASAVSHQTILNHFESKEGVLVAVAEILRGETETARYAAKPGDIAGTIRALVGEYEQMGDANVRWAMTSDRFEAVSSLLDEARSSHQSWLAAMFGDDLPKSPTARRRTIQALHVATDVYSWKLLRRDLSLTRTETESTMALLVSAVLERTRRSADSTPSTRPPGTSPSTSLATSPSRKKKKGSTS